MRQYVPVLGHRLDCGVRTGERGRLAETTLTLPPSLRVTPQRQHSPPTTVPIGRGNCAPVLPTQQYHGFIILLIGERQVNSGSNLRCQPRDYRTRLFLRPRSCRPQCAARSALPVSRLRASWRLHNLPCQRRIGHEHVDGFVRHPSRLWRARGAQVEKRLAVGALERIRRLGGGEGYMPSGQ